MYSCGASYHALTREARVAIYNHDVNDRRTLVLEVTRGSRYIARLRNSSHQLNIKRKGARL